MNTLITTTIILLVSFVLGAISDYPRFSDYTDHECIRTCRKQHAPRICRYSWVLENYLTLSRACYSCPTNATDCLRPHCVPADGVSRTIRTANRKIPGPSIQVCEGDIVEVEIVNLMMMSEGISIHWHGLHQRHSPHMDGVSMVTQCPILTSTNFTYRFVADTPGTHFWHSHAGLNQVDGLFGSVIVRQTSSREPHATLYDEDLPEHVIVINDWSYQPADSLISLVMHGKGLLDPDSILINGRGRQQKVDPDEPNQVPLTEFKVEQGKKYRFRVIGAGMLRCPIRLSVDDHELLVIASDGRAFKPFPADSVDIYSGERYDFIIDAHQGTTQRNTFMIHARGLLDCTDSDVEQLAVLRYLNTLTVLEENLKLWQNSTKELPQASRAFNVLPKASSGLQLDPRILISEMTSLEKNDVSLKTKPDVRFFLEFSIKNVGNWHAYDSLLYPSDGQGYPKTFSPQINGISNVLPKSPLLTQSSDLDENDFCNSASVNPNCGNGLEYCECLHGYSVSMGNVIEFVVISRSNSQVYSHPIHWHGHSLRVVAMDRLEEPMSVDLFKKLDRKGKIKRKLDGAPFKDTVPLPDGGYLILRMETNNPGVWFIHCHFPFHVEPGMSLYLHVPNNQGHLPSPPSDFPRCNSWSPTPRLSENQEDRKEAFSSSSSNNDSVVLNLRQMLGDSPYVLEKSSPVSSPGNDRSTLKAPAWFSIVVTVLALALVILAMTLAVLVRKSGCQKTVKRTWFALPYSVRCKSETDPLLQ